VRPTIAFACPKPLHVAVIAPPWMELPPTGYGGIEAVCADLIAALLRGGHRVTLVGAGRNGTGANFVQTYDRPQGERIGQTVPEVVHAAALPTILGDLDVDVVHDHTFAGPLLAAAHGLPTVVTAHGPVGGEIGGYYRNISRWVHLVAISDAQRTCAPDIPWCGTVHNGLEPTAYPVTTHKEEYALFLGRMCPEKGVVTAISTARAAGVPLVIAAKCREAAERRYFDELIAPLLGEDVRWVGEVGGAAKSDLLGRARCLLFPIDWEEPFGMVMIEAMACGTPVVATARGSVPEIVRHGETGFVFPDERALAAAIRAAPEIGPARCRRGGDPVQRRQDGRGLRVDLPAGGAADRAGGRRGAHGPAGRPRPADARRGGAGLRAGPEDVVTVACHCTTPSHRCPTGPACQFR
jgi:glycosyltransferase involved in cell wall biosynthesis